MPTVAHLSEKQAWLAQSGAGAGGKNAAWTGEQQAALAGSGTSGKNTAPTAEHISEKQAWLAQNGAASAGMAMDAGKGGEMNGQGGPFEEAQAGSSGGKNTAPTAEHISEKQAWLAQNGNASSDMAMDAGKENSGQGGPLEEAQAGASGEAVWPACRPGPGDDRCIQMYERGVSRAFAQWSAGRSRMGMGGPEEPANGKDQMTSMTSDMSAAAAKVDGAAGPTTEPTGVRVAGKTAMSASMNAAGGDMVAADGALVDDSVTARQMQTNSAPGAKANGS
jgi:hypothetical protein